MKNILSCSNKLVIRQDVEYGIIFPFRGMFLKHIVFDRIHIIMLLKKYPPRALWRHVPIPISRFPIPAIGFWAFNETY